MIVIRLSVLTFTLLFSMIARPQAGNAQPYVPSQLLVRFIPSATQGARDSAVAAVNGSYSKSIEPVFLIALADTNVLASVDSLNAKPCVDVATPNLVGGEVFAPNDSLFATSWHLANTGQSSGTAGADIDAIGGWAFIKKSASVRIGLMDTGTNDLHADLDSNIFRNPDEIPGDNIDNDNNGYIDDIHGWDFFGGDADTQDPLSTKHGTYTASVLAMEGDNAIGGTGVTWDVQIIPLRVAACTQVGGGIQCGIPTDAQIDAIRYAWKNGAKVISASYGAWMNIFVAAEIESAQAHNVLFVAGVNGLGLKEDDFPSYPAQYNVPAIITVGMTDRIDSLVTGTRPCSNGAKSGWSATLVDIAAPGCDICTAEAVGGYSCGHSGTSLATPQVAAAAALLYEQNPGITNHQVKARLMATVDTLPSLVGRTLSQGRLNIERALDNVKPSAVSDLTVVGVGRYSQAISWTDTGDDSTNGQARAYNTSASTLPGFYPYPPSPAGTFHCIVISGLNSCQSYSWSVRLEDNAFNVSNASNSASANTECAGSSVAICDEFLMGGGGDGGEGGGEETVRIDGGTSEASAGFGSAGITLNALSNIPPIRLSSSELGTFSWKPENGLRIGTVDGEVTDLLAMKSIRPRSGGDYNVRLAATGGRAINLLDASLGIIDHGSGSVALVTPNGVFTGTPGSISSAIVEGGDNRTGAYQSGEGAVSEAGETINVSLSGEGQTLLTIDLAARATTAELSVGGIDVLTRDGQGAWTTVAHVVPRRGLDKVAVDVTGAAGVRLVVGRRVFIRSLSTVTGASAAEPTWLDLTSIQMSGGGGNEPGNFTLLPAEHAALTFAGVNQEEGTERAVFLRVTSQSEAEGHFSGSAGEQAPAPQVEFALAMRPNPSSGHVAIDYVMARDTNVQIRMYDVAGRLVRTLAKGRQTVGPHSIAWDARDEAGAPVRGGVYFCKMEVGSWTNVKKMVFVPGR